MVRAVSTRKESRAHVYEPAVRCALWVCTRSVAVGAGAEAVFESSRLARFLAIVLSMHAFEMAFWTEGARTHTQQEHIGWSAAHTNTWSHPLLAVSWHHATLDGWRSFKMVAT